MSKRKLGENDPGRYEINILIGPCDLAEAEAALLALAEAARGLDLGAATSLTTWDEDV